MDDLVRRFLARSGVTGPGMRPSLAAEPGDDPADQRAAALLAEVERAVNGRWLSEPDLRALPQVKAVLDADDDVRGAVVIRLVNHRLDPRLAEGKLIAGMYSLLGVISRRKLTMAADQLLPLLRHLEEHLGGSMQWQASSVIEQLSPVIERSITDLAGDDQRTAVELVAGLVRSIEGDNLTRVSPVAMKRLRAVWPADAHGVLDPVATDDSVGPALLGAVTRSPETDDQLSPFLAHVVAAGKGRPSAAWLAKTATLARGLHDAPLLIRALLQAALDAEDRPIVYHWAGTAHESIRWIAPANEPIVRNVVWAAGALKDPDAIPLLRALALKTIAVIGGQFGTPRSLTVAMSCPGAIGTIGSPAALTGLQGLQRATRHGSLLREVGKAIDTLAASGNVSRSELLETAVERHDLDATGQRELPVGDWTAVLQVSGSGEVATAWLDPERAQRATLPKRVRDAEPSAAKAVSAATKQIRDTVGAERARLDRLFVENRRWPLAEWRTRYLEHPITGTLARSLVWRFGDVVGMPSADGSSAVVPGGTENAIPADAEVTLWHPIESSDDEVGASREWLMAERRTQPLKQAFRELYVVTPAELETRTYSNRFAGHVIRQVQARALMKGRNWAAVAVAWWDDGIDHGVARRSLDGFGVRAEFFYDPVTDVQPATTALYPYCATDQVRFYRLGSADPMPIDEVPPVAFSEVMRDVDLFVGVASIGTDAQWLDRGERRFDTYWHDWGFGELGQPARIRREVIAKLLPALAIADRCTLTDRHLVVRGDLHTYKIHLGSSNIQMSPNDKYLCIVAARHPSDHSLFLPFEDDSVLSVILSKAFLLANDGAISDRSILQQMGR